MGSAKQVARSVDDVVATADDVCTDDASLGDLRGAAEAVTRALDDLLNHVRGGGRSRQVKEVETIQSATDQLMSSMGDTNEMVRQARVLAQATTLLVNALQGTPAILIPKYCTSSESTRVLCTFRRSGGG